MGRQEHRDIRGDLGRAPVLRLSEALPRGFHEGEVRRPIVSAGEQLEREIQDRHSWLTTGPKNELDLIGSVGPDASAFDASPDGVMDTLAVSKRFLREEPPNLVQTVERERKGHPSLGAQTERVLPDEAGRRGDGAAGKGPPGLGVGRVPHEEPQGVREQAIRGTDEVEQRSLVPGYRLRAHPQDDGSEGSPDAEPSLPTGGLPREGHAIRLETVGSRCLRRSFQGPRAILEDILYRGGGICGEVHPSQRSTLPQRRRHREDLHARIVQRHHARDFGAEHPGQDEGEGPPGDRAFVIGFRGREEDVR